MRQKMFDADSFFKEYSNKDLPINHSKGRVNKQFSSVRKKLEITINRHLPSVVKMGY